MNNNIEKVVLISEKIRKIDNEIRQIQKFAEIFVDRDCIIKMEITDPSESKKVSFDEDGSLVQDHESRIQDIFIFPMMRERGKKPHHKFECNISNETGLNIFSLLLEIKLGKRKELINSLKKLGLKDEKI